MKSLISICSAIQTEPNGNRAIHDPTLQTPFRRFYEIILYIQAFSKKKITCNTCSHRNRWFPYIPPQCRPFSGNSNHGVFLKPIYLQTSFAHLGYEVANFPRSVKPLERIFSIPIHTKMNITYKIIYSTLKAVQTSFKAGNKI